MTLSFLDEPARHLVTGGAGFIGSHLVDRLLAMGHQVTVYDNLVARGKGGWSEPPPKEGLRLVKADLLDMETLQQSMKGHQLVWHLAANTDIPSGIKNIRMDLENCTIATHNVLEAMCQTGVKRIAFTSTSAVYGETDRMPLTEETGPVLPISLYGAGKLACEGFVSAFCHLFDMQAWIFRFGNVIGAQMGHGVIYDFIQKLRRSPHELEVLGDGKQEKNYFLVEDCIDGMLCAVRNSPKQCDVFVLGSESTAKVTEIAQIVIEEMALPDVRIRFTGGKRGWPGDVPQVHFDLGKMKKLGWGPKHTSLEAVRVATRRLLGK